MIRIAAGILAGGKSSRMGKNKASLSWNGTTFLETVLDACQNFHEIYVSVDKIEKYNEIPHPLVEDEKKEYGPLEGIYQILKCMKADYAFMLATDMPMVNREFLQSVAEKLNGDEDCLVLRLEGRPQPLCSLYSKRVLPFLEEMREKEEHKPGMLFERVKTRFLDIEELGFSPELLNNVNTRQEYEWICRKKEKHLTEFAPYVQGKLGEGRVFVCYLDGLGYSMYENGKKQGCFPYVEAHFQVVPAVTVKPPVTNPAMATMLTGVMPEVHGIHSRKDRTPLVPTIFAGREIGSTVYLEGDSRILNTEIPPVLHTEKQGQGVDYWTVRDAKNAVEGNAGFIFMHLHEVDDLAHTFGPFSKEVMEQMKKEDEWIGMLAESFNGCFLLISDHGLHETEEGGTHGEVPENKTDREFCSEDMLAVWGERI